MWRRGCQLLEQLLDDERFHPVFGKVEVHIDASAMDVGVFPANGHGRSEQHGILRVGAITAREDLHIAGRRRDVDFFGNSLFTKGPGDIN